MAKKEANKITESELQEVQKYANAMNQLQMQIGMLAVQQNDLMLEMGTLRTGMQEVQNALMAEYGDITVNLQDGTFVENASNS